MKANSRVQEYQWIKWNRLPAESRVFIPDWPNLGERPESPPFKFRYIPISYMRIIHNAIATIITFSVSEMNPNGTLLDPPTQAHFNSRLSR